MKSQFNIFLIFFTYYIDIVKNGYIIRGIERGADKAYRGTAQRYKKMKKNLKEMLKELEEGRRDEKIYLNILYFLASKYFICDSVRTLTVDDLEYVYDNLYINNELIDCDNVDRYDLNKLGISAKNQEVLKSGRKVLLLNYYTVRGELKDCKIWLDAIYNRLVY